MFIGLAATIDAYSDRPFLILDDQINQLKSKSGGLFSNTEKKLKELEASQVTERGEIKVQIDSIDAAIKQEYDRFLTKVDQANNKQTMNVDTAIQLKQIETNNEKILELKSSVHDTDIGSFRFIAQAFNIEVDTAVKWFIMMIVIVFDPLAMCLIIGYNVYVHGQAGPVNKNVIPTMINPRATGVKIAAKKK